jgi:two-component system nitrate/nitrite response regulator NarL
MVFAEKTQDLARKYRLLLVEDNPLFVEQICGAIEQLTEEWGVTLVEEGLRALSLISEKDQRFDLALIDIGLPDISGLEVIRACAKRFPEMPIVVISVMASEPVVLSAIEAGAKGYILKGESIQEITRGISQVMDGIYPLSPSLARFLFKKLAGEQVKSPQPASQEVFNLTPRELETLRYLSQGLTYEGVAEQMGVALSTIQWNVRNLYRKLNVRSQVQAISKARDHDLI